MNTSLTIQQLINKFLLQKDIAASSRKTYRSTVHSFFRWMVMKKYNAARPTRENVIEYKAELIAERKSDATVSLYLNSLKSFFTWLEEENISKNIASKIKAPKRYEGFKKHRLSIDQIYKLLGSIDINTIIGQRDYTMILMGFANGLRTIELSRLLIDDIDTVNLKAHVQRKGDVQPMQWLPFTDDVLSAITIYIQSRIDNGENVNDDSHLFISHKNKSHKGNPLTAQQVGVIISKRLKACALHSKTVTAHSLRHSAGSYLLELGWSIYEVQKFLGHASIRTTEIYLKSADLVNLQQEKPQQSLMNLLKKNHQHE